MCFGRHWRTRDSKRTQGDTGPGKRSPPMRAGVVCIWPSNEPQPADVVEEEVAAGGILVSNPYGEQPCCSGGSYGAPAA